jgi:hypothetical protein
MKIRFEKQRAMSVIDAIRSGKPIQTGPEGWEPEDLLLLASVCTTVACTVTTERSGWDALHLEHMEHMQGQVYEKQREAVLVFCELIGDILLGEYDRKFEPEIEMTIVSSEGRPTAVVTRGVRGKEASE